MEITTACRSAIGPWFWGRTFSNSAHGTRRRFGGGKSGWNIRPRAIMKCGRDRTSITRRKNTVCIIRQGFIFIIFWRWFVTVDGFWGFRLEEYQGVEELRTYEPITYLLRNLGSRRLVRWFGCRNERWVVGVNVCCLNFNQTLCVVRRRA